MSILKRKVLENVLLDEHVIKKLNNLTVRKLCVRLNTLKVCAFMYIYSFSFIRRLSYLVI